MHKMRLRMKYRFKLFRPTPISISTDAQKLS